MITNCTFLFCLENDCIGCWAKDPHMRPSFRDILKELDAIARSGFTQTPNESFQTMQDGWKKEIAEVLHELRLKEKVMTSWPKQKSGWKWGNNIFFFERKRLIHNLFESKNVRSFQSTTLHTSAHIYIYIYRFIRLKTKEKKLFNSNSTILFVILFFIAAFNCI